MSTRNFLIFFVLILIAIGGSFVLEKSSTAVPLKNTNDSVALNREARKSIDEKDSDLDGLKDWEENLIGTDPFNPDSDSDGILDGDDSNSQKLNLMSSLDEHSDTSSSAKSTTENTKESSKTDILAQALFSEYITIKTINSGDIDETDIDQIVLSTLRTSGGNVEYEKYSLSDLNTIPTETIDAIKDYGNIMGFLINRDVPGSGAEYPPEAFSKVFEEGDLSAFNSLLESYTNYESFIEQALIVETPLSASFPHLRLVNTISRLSMVIKNMILYYEDLYSAMKAVEEYELIFNDLLDISNSFESYFNGRDIFFRKNNFGYDLINIVEE